MNCGICSKPETLGWFVKVYVYEFLNEIKGLFSQQINNLIILQNNDLIQGKVKKN